MDPVMSVYTIYDHPRDYPEYFVVRAWHVIDGQPEPVPDMKARLFTTLKEARASIPSGLVKTPPMWEQDPVILETWI